MLRVSKLTDYATVLMAALADDPDTVASASELAERAGIELPTVSKLLKQLATAGLVESRRGVNGGYRLAHAAGAISVLDIGTAIEGPIGMTECSLHEGSCALGQRAGSVRSGGAAGHADPLWVNLVAGRCAQGAAMA